MAAAGASTGHEHAGPPAAWQVVSWGGALVMMLVVVVLAVHRPQGPLDQRDPARQRDGLAEVRGEVGAEVDGVHFGGQVVELLFLRAPVKPAVLHAFAAQQPGAVRLLAVLPFAPVPPGYLADPNGHLALAVKLPSPIDGGPGVGYAVVDAQRRVRYSTLDPDWRSNAFEPAVIAAAVS